ncbi:MAG: hypothetical protein KAS75_07790 [Planctomycetes bacterium]|nr:hypothetical protein [Planctomycetota bacterium]
MANLIEPQKHVAFSGKPMIVAWLAMLLFACHASTHMVGAGDTWVAMACGRHFINHGVDTVEPFSANSHKAGPTEKDIEKWPPFAQWITEKVGLETVKYWHPTGWVNQNWLTHVIFYWTTHLSPFADAEELSFNSLVYWKFAVYILIVICVYYTGKLLGVNPALSAFFACAALFIGRSFFDIRPAGFSNLLVAAFLLVLVLTTYRNILYIWLIVPIVVFWCNVHGGYLYVFIMLVPFIGLHFLASFFPQKFVAIGKKGLCHTIAASFVAFVAMIIFNPFHLTNLTHTFIISLSKHAEMWRSVHEWWPAFAWSSPVGTGFPFLIMFILSIGLTMFWLCGFLLKPKFLKAPKNELQAQKKQFEIISTILGYTAAAFICWVAFIAFSFMQVNLTDFAISAAFAVIVLLSIRKNIHFIYFAILLSILALWSGATSGGYSGRYVYPFILLPTYVVMYLIVSLLSEKVKSNPKNILFVLAAAVVALVLAVVIFNPFKFESSIWDVRQFFSLSRVWSSKYERSSGVNYKYLFSILYMINVISVAVWAALPSLKKIFSQQPTGIAEEPEAQTYELPKIDLALMAVGALTIYMAIRSRRFIPIAAIAACPILAMLIEQVAHMISASRNFHSKNRFFVRAMSHNLQLFFTLFATVIVLTLGTFWSLKFKRIYLDFWPSDAKLNSIFIRMTASEAKPFYACQFIRDNKLKGNMFNYWTEGGFIAWGQVPDLNTGRTPLQLFMDGRAQAAYEPIAYERWNRIMSGGPEYQKAKIRKRNLTGDDYTKIGQWISHELRKRNVWVVLMPGRVQNDVPIIARALERNSNWPVVFFNNKQRLFVDVTTPQGKELFEGIFNGRTIYPDDFSENLALAHNMLAYAKEDDMRKRGLDFAINAFKLHPSQAPMLEMTYATRFSELKAEINDFCQSYLDDFEKNRGIYSKQDGYHHRVSAAYVAAFQLQRKAKEEKDKELAVFYSAKQREYFEAGKELANIKRW